MIYWPAWLSRDEYFVPELHSYANRPLYPQNTIIIQCLTNLW